MKTIWMILLGISAYGYEIVVDKSLSAEEKSYMETLSQGIHTRNIDKGSHIFPAMVQIPSGTFQMGSNDGDADEKPLHEVTIKNSFYMGKYEVSVGEFRKFINDTNYKTDADKTGSCWVWNGKWEQQSGLNWDNPGFDQSENHPVACVSHNDAKAYTEWLAKKTTKRFTLPSEAQWEYAARSKTTTKYSWGDTIDCSKADYNNDGCNKKGTSAVGSYPSNPFGLYDMSGNVWEWCEDWYVDSYKTTPKDGTANTTGAKSYKVLRSGGWIDDGAHLRSANRIKTIPTYLDNFSGFRVVLLP
jgi:formylglycine-generating enzyme required for sulfatase activity